MFEPETANSEYDYQNILVLIHIILLMFCFDTMLHNEKKKRTEIGTLKGFIIVLLFHSCAILPYKVKRTRKICHGITQ